MSQVSNRLKINNFNLLFENGVKINKKKIHKLDEILSKQFKDQNNVDAVIITSDNLQKNIFEEEQKEFTNALEKFHLGTENIRKIFKTSCFANSELRRLENQMRIFQIVSNFYDNTMQKIQSKTEKLNKLDSGYRAYKHDLDSRFQQNLNGFVATLKDLDVDDQNFDFGMIQRASTNFKKSFAIFETKLRHFDETFKNFKEKSNAKYKGEIQYLEPLSQAAREVGDKMRAIYNMLWSNVNNPSSLKEVIAKVENLWLSNDYNQFLDKIDGIFRIRVSSRSNLFRKRIPGRSRLCWMTNVRR